MSGETPRRLLREREDASSSQEMHSQWIESCACYLVETIPYIKHVLARMARSQSGRGLRLVHMQALLVIARYPGITVTAVAQHVGHTLPVASKMLQDLCRHGYIERTAMPGNRRSMMMTLTPMGEVALRESYQVLVANLTKRLSATPEIDWQALVWCLAQLRETLLQTRTDQPGVRSGRSRMASQTMSDSDETATRYVYHVEQTCQPVSGR